MGEFSKWLLHEDQKELFDYLFAIVLNAVFLVLTALLLWPLGKAMMTLRLAKGYWVFWSALIVAASVLFLFQRFFRMDLYSRFDAYLISSLIVGGFLQVGWSAFAAPVIHSSVTEAPIWMMVVIYGVGVISCYVACVIVSTLFIGTLYRMANAVLAVLSFIIFSIWPDAGGVTYGWFFDLFDRF